MSNTPNYPDILGAVTGGARYNLGVVQLALATRPRVVRAGRTFEALLLVQNASDVDVDLTATLYLPEKDAQRQANQFKAQAQRLVVGLCPAEVGYVKLPILCAPTTAVHDEYTIGVAVQVKTLEKPQRIRQAQGGGPVDTLSANAQTEIEPLQKLHFSVRRHFALKDVIEVPFSVMPGRLGQIADLQPGWVSLWTMTDHVDHTGLLDMYAPLLAQAVLPKLQPAQTLKALHQATLTHFEAAGFPLQSIEALFIAKSLARVLQLADPIHDLNDYRSEDVYNVLRTIEKLKPGTNPPLPHWCEGMLHSIAHNKAVAQHPARIISEKHYLALVRDAIPLTLQLIEAETGHDLGSAEDRQQYGNELVGRLHDQGGMDTGFAYLPLLLGGVLLHTRVIAENERLDDEMRRLGEQVEARQAEQNDENAEILAMTGEMIERYGQQYNFVL
jgi:hypothetical protein